MLLNTEADGDAVLVARQPHAGVLRRKASCRSIPVDGGEPTIVTDAAEPRGGDWSGDRLMFAAGQGISVVAPDGSGLQRSPTRRTKGTFSTRGRSSCRTAAASCSSFGAPKPSAAVVYMGSLDGGPPRRLMAAYSRVTYSAGYLFWVRDGTPRSAQPFDADRRAAVRIAVALQGRVKSHARGDAAFDVVPSGDPDLLPRGRRGVDAAAADRPPRPDTPEPHRRRRLSPAPLLARRHPHRRRKGESRRRQCRLSGSTTSPGRARAGSPAATPRTSIRCGRPTDGPSCSRRSGTRPINSSRSGWTVPSPERPFGAIVRRSDRGGCVAATGGTCRRRSRAGAVDVPAGRRRQKPWPCAAIRRRTPGSPNSRRTGGSSPTCRRSLDIPEVFVEPFPGTASAGRSRRRAAASRTGERTARSCSTCPPTDWLMSIDTSACRTGSTRTAGPPLFASRCRTSTAISDYAVSPDGQSFVLNVFLSDPVTPPLDVVVNWRPC